jgi:hypothetical protein
MDADHSNITDDLSKLLKRLNEISARDFAILADAQLQWKPRPECWSIVECLQHLVLQLELYLPKIDQAVLKGKTFNITADGTAFRSGFLGKYLLSSIRIKDDNSIQRFSKCPNKLRPESTIEGAASLVVENYFQYSAQLLNLLSVSKALHLEQIKVTLPLVPLFRLKLGDMLQYLVYHIERHIVQAQKVHCEVGFPRVGNLMI